MVLGDLLHLRDKRLALSPFPLNLFQLACQSHGFGIQLRVNHAADQIEHLLNPHRMLLKQFPYDRLRVDQPVSDQQSLRVGFTKFLRCIARVNLWLQNKDGCPDLPIVQKIFSER